MLKLLAAVAAVSAVFFVLKQQSLDHLKFQQEMQQFFNLAQETWETFKPGGKLHPQYFLEHKGHIIIEGALIAIMFVIYFQRSFKPYSKSDEPLTEKEIDELCRDWQPEPLAGKLPEHVMQWEPPVISSTCGLYVTANGKKALNMASHDYLALAGDPEIMAACERTINKYGVGACGPRGFYGTIDVHLHLEERVAKFLGTEGSILYAYDLATVPSVIPAFANRNDVIVCDEAVNYGIQKGCNLSRAKVYTFKHNNMADLERVLKQIVDSDKKRGKHLTRRFIAIEGIYINTGEVAPLRAIYELKEKYKFRLILDETVSLGVLGPTGRGAWEEAELHVGDIEIIAASMGHALSSVGGFCAGTLEVTEHQRLSGLGYCFSAALPPYLATAAIESINRLDSEGTELLPQLHVKCQILRRQLADIAGLQLVGPIDTVTPVSHVRIAADVPAEAGDHDELLRQITDDALKKEGVLFTVASYSFLDKQRPPPSIKITVTVAHEDKELQKAPAVLAASTSRVLKLKTGVVYNSPSLQKTMSRRRSLQA